MRNNVLFHVIHVAVFLTLVQCTSTDYAYYHGQKKSSKNVLYGKASYYGPKFHGRKTANGEVFDQHALTAAHKTLPFNTVCKVTNLFNKKQVTVRINDRGPFVGNRILDLSLGAAKKIDGLSQGVMDVKIEIMKWGE